MLPDEIRLELFRLRLRGITSQAEIARKCKVTDMMVSKVIARTAVSDKVARKIAEVLDRPVEEVFPERYPKPAIGNTNAP